MKPLILALLLVFGSTAAVAQEPAVAATAPARAHAASETLLRRWIEGAIAGQPDYGLLSTSLADAVRPQMGAMQGLMQRFGALQSLEHVAVENGADIYVARFATANTRWTVAVNEQGLITGLRFRPEN
jgi:hypothetical protein